MLTQPFLFRGFFTVFCSSERFFLLILALAVFVSEAPCAAISSDEAPTPIVASENKARRISGPYGTLEYYPVTLEPPESHLWAALYEERSYWNFGPREISVIQSLLSSLGILPETLALIDREGKWDISPRGLELTITDAIVESMRPEDRSALAHWLRLNNPTFFAKSVINLEGGDFGAFESASVAPETMALVKQVAFRRNNVLSIMDRAYILNKIADQNEKKRFIRAALATRGLFVNLILDETSDLNSIISYWSAQGRNKEIDSFIRGVAATSGVTRLDLVQILPSVPRRYLYGYTSLSDVGPFNTPDCFWAALQFFQRKASPRLIDSTACVQHLEGEFQEVSGPPEFGDIVCMFKKDDNSFLHAYVHIAGDIVFTKNGTSFARPFVLTEKSDMLSVYLDETEHVDRIYRHKISE